jgi:plasmid maintenance system antidote protein VapI
MPTTNKYEAYVPLIQRFAIGICRLGNSSVTAEMAIRIARTVGGSSESWLRMQEALDLWNAEMKFKNNPRLAPKALAA